jgi:hypothetical protein
MSWASFDDVVSTLAVVWVKQPDAETGGVSRGDLRGAGDRFLVGHERLGECEKRKEKKETRAGENPPITDAFTAWDHTVLLYTTC